MILRMKWWNEIQSRIYFVKMQFITAVKDMGKGKRYLVHCLVSTEMFTQPSSPINGTQGQFPKNLQFGQAKISVMIFQVWLLGCKNQI